jgi:hypothetical protein
MSIITSAVPAYQATARTSAESSQSNGVASAAAAPQRETELARQLAARLTDELLRIRQQINSGASASSDVQGQRLDIRA